MNKRIRMPFKKYVVDFNNECANRSTLFGGRRLLLMTLIGFFALALTACDKREDESEELLTAWQCNVLVACHQSNTRFGMVGDSWTDFAYGLEVQHDLRDWLTEDHGYQITDAVLAGQTLSGDLHEARGFQRVIEKAGPELKYMLLSLGGNDLLANISAYENAATRDAIIANRFDTIESNLRSMIYQGNSIKQGLYGGTGLVWIIHGYDYANPAKVAFCDLSSTALTTAEKEALMQNLLDRYNTRLLNISAAVPELHYIDLRGTLGGPPVSDPNLKLDCIHPNEVGFRMVTNRYVEALRLITTDK